MAIDWIDGFEDYPGIQTAGVGHASYWTWNSGQGQSSLVAGRVGGQAWQVGGVGDSDCYRSITPDDEISMFFAMNINQSNWSNAADMPFLSLDTTALKHIQLGTNQARELFVLGPAGTDLARIPDVIAVNTYYSIAMTVKIHDSLGEVKVWVNGELKINLANVDTQNGASPNANRVSIRRTTNNNLRLDDFRVDVNSLVQIPEGRFAVATLNADDAVQFTKNGGATNFSRVADATCDQDTTYNSSNTVGHKDRFTIAGLGFNPDNIMAVQVTLIARKDDVATRRIRSFLTSDADTENGADMFLSTDYTINRMILPLDPDGDVPWTKAQVEAIKVGYELVE